MEFQIGDIVKLKKAHPCGINEWEILRVGNGFSFKMCWMWQTGDGAKKDG